jgi:hypothetical protein
MLDYATRKAIPLISESCQLLLYDDIILIEELAIIISNIIQHQFPTFANYTQIFDASSIETLAKGYIVNTSSLLERLAKHHSLFKVIVETLLQFNDTPKNVVYSLYQRIQISQLPSILNMVFEASKEEELIEILTDFADKLQDWEKDAIQIDESQI